MPHTYSKLGLAWNPFSSSLVVTGLYCDVVVCCVQRKAQEVCVELTGQYEDKIAQVSVFMHSQ